MPACKVLSHLGGGQYSVLVYRDDGSVESRKAVLTERLSVLSTEISNLESGNLTTTYNNWQSNLNYLDDLIDAIGLVEPLSDNYKQLTEAIKNQTKTTLISRNNYSAQKEIYESLLSDKAALNSELTRLNSKTIADTTMTVWCVDLSDGVDGRAIYAANEESDLWCLNYDAGSKSSAQYLLPPKNMAVSAITREHYNTPGAYPELTAACMTFANVAMESGFARWSPLLLKGIVVVRSEDEDDRDCNDPIESKDDDLKKLKVNISKYTNRFSGTGGATGSPLCVVTYFDGVKAFQDGDLVVIIPEVNDSGIVTGGSIVGFVNNPKINDSDDEDNGTCEILKETLRLLLEVNDYQHSHFKVRTLDDPSVITSYSSVLNYTSVWDGGDVKLSEMGNGSHTAYTGRLLFSDDVDYYSISSCEFTILLHVNAKSHEYSDAGSIYSYSETPDITYMEIAGVLIPWRHRVLSFTNGIYNDVTTYMESLTSLCVSTGAYGGVEKTVTMATGPIINRTVTGAQVTTREFEVDCNGVFTIISETTESIAYERTLNIPLVASYEAQSGVIEDTLTRLTLVTSYGMIGSPPQTAPGSSTC